MNGYVQTLPCSALVPLTKSITEVLCRITWCSLKMVLFVPVKWVFLRLVPVLVTLRGQFWDRLLSKCVTWNTLSIKMLFSFLFISMTPPFCCFSYLPQKTKTKQKSQEITPVLASMHQLPVCCETDSKTLIFTFQSSPYCISDFLVAYEPECSLRSRSWGLLSCSRGTAEN